MATQTTPQVLTQAMPIYNGIFFASTSQCSMPELRRLIAEGIQLGDQAMRFFGTHKSDIFHAMDYLFVNFFKSEGRITTGMLFDAIEQIAGTYDMFKHLTCLASNYKELSVDCASEESNLIGVGRMVEEYIGCDKDTQMTAGCYNNWIAPMGTLVKYYLNTDLSIQAVFEVSITLEHYNNNFYGVSTGNGDTTYEIGKNVTKRSVKLGREWIDKNWTKNTFPADVRKVDGNKATKLASELVPDFAFLVK